MVTIANLCPYWTYPPTGGGPLRVYNLNCAMAEKVKIVQFSARPTFGHQQAGWSGWIGSRTHQIKDNYLEYQYFHPLILSTGYVLYRLGAHSDIFISQSVEWLVKNQVRELTKDASIIQVEHPWLFDLGLNIANGRPVVYVAHNIESVLWDKSEQKQFRSFKKLANRVSKLERRASESADAIVAMSAVDSKKLVSEFAADPKKITVIPNGVDLQTRSPTNIEKKAIARRRLRLDKRPVLLFTGSDHYPNKEALYHISQWQDELGTKLGVQFVIVGGVGNGFTSTNHMRVEGFVPDITDYLSAADIALNPLISGSGTSLKVVEYLACGLPTVTTPIGIRGLNAVPEHDVLMGDVFEFPSLIARLISDQALQSKLASNGRQLVNQNYGWSQLGQKMLDIYWRLLK